MPGAKLHYFRGIVRHLETLGCHAHAVRLPAAASVPERAQMLVDKIDAMAHDRVDIIAHSLGGLDARYALSRLGLARRVRALVTVGTPHHGTPLADLGRSSLFVYWIHVEMVYGAMSAAIHRRLTFEQALVAFVLFSTALFGLARLKERLVTQWRAEGVRRFARV